MTMPKNESRELREGLIFIPDISGFTELVHSTDLETGKQITCELLSAVISANNLELKVAEVEGDAILFYRYGTAPRMSELAGQCQKMVQAFENKVQDLQVRFYRKLDLSLKVIAHYGPMTSYMIGPFQKLFGAVVVEAHRLLKNSIESGSYLLVTDALLDQTGACENELNELSSRYNKLCEVYGSLRNICFSYMDYQEVA